MRSASSLRRLGRLLCWVLAGALLASACGGVSTDTLADAVAATTAAGALRVTIDGTADYETEAFGRIPSVHATGVVDLAAMRRELQVSVFPGLDADFDAAELSYDVDVIVSDGEVFQRGLPGFTADAWIRIDDAPEAISADLATYVSPAAMLSLLDGLSGPVTEVGQEPVAGVQTTRVRLVLPPERMRRRVDDVVDRYARSDLVGELATEIRAAGVTANAVAEVWIDEDGLIRQLVLDSTVTLGDGQAVPGFGIADNSLILRLDPVAEPVTISPPSSENRTGFADLTFFQFSGGL